MNNNINTDFLPKKKAEFIKRQYAEISDNIQPLNISVYSNASIIPLGYIENACFNSVENRFVEDLDLCADIKSASPHTAIEDCTALYCGYLHHNAWGHFITNTLARMWPITRPDLAVDKYVFLTTTPITGLQGNFAELFRLLGIDQKIEILTQPKAYKKIIAGELSFALPLKVYPEYVELIAMIRNSALSGSEQGDDAGKPLFFTRSALPLAGSRDIGIEYIDRFYRDNGYKILYPERMSLTDMIRAIDQAPKIAFISGSGAHNSIFASPGKEIHIIERSAICNIFQPIIEDAFAHKVVYVEAQYSLLPVPYGSGPFLYAKTRWLEDYAHSLGYSVPETSQKQVAQNFKKYLRIREQNHRYRWWIDSWAADQLDVFNEASSEARKHYSQFIGGDGACYVSPLKRFAKKLLKLLRH